MTFLYSLCFSATVLKKKCRCIHFSIHKCSTLSSFQQGLWSVAGKQTLSGAQAEFLRIAKKCFWRSYLWIGTQAWCALPDQQGSSWIQYYDSSTRIYLEKYSGFFWNLSESPVATAVLLSCYSSPVNHLHASPPWRPPPSSTSSQDSRCSSWTP